MKNNPNNKSSNKNIEKIRAKDIKTKENKKLIQSKRQAFYKPLSFSTTMRNPQRIAEFLKVLLPFENRILTHEIIIQIVASLISQKLYVPRCAKNYKKELESDENLSKTIIQDIVANSPQKHKEAGFDYGWDSRFDTWYRLPMEFGFCFYAMNEKLEISNTGHMLIDAFSENPSNDIKIASIFTNCMMKYQSNNPFRNTLNANIPLTLLLNVMQKLQEFSGDSKIHKQEIAFFLCWRDDNFEALTKYLLDFREKYPSFAYSNDIIYEKCLELLETKNTILFKKSKICGESIDEYIRKMRITGIISLRGNGRFLDFNTFESSKIQYIIKNYSNIKDFKETKEYFAYMGEIDFHILEIKENISLNQESLKQKTLNDFALNYTKKQIYEELIILANKKSSSKNEVFKFIPEPTRFEFLTAIALKQSFQNLEVLPNYSIDDEGLPKNHASGNMPDIICKDSLSDSLVEVSLICGRGQVNNELIPITRHLKEYKESNKQNTKKHFAIFIAPQIFEDSKVYVEFIDFKEKLKIKNFSIIDFINSLKHLENIVDFLNV